MFEPVKMARDLKPDLQWRFFSENGEKNHYWQQLCKSSPAGRPALSRAEAELGPCGRWPDPALSPGCAWGAGPRGGAAGWPRQGAPSADAPGDGGGRGGAGPAGGGRRGAAVPSEGVLWSRAGRAGAKLSPPSLCTAGPSAMGSESISFLSKLEFIQKHI